jgi:hypothetical protein
MVKDISSRVKESFNEDDKEQILEYMGWINSSILNYVQTVRRNVGILLLLVAIFELVTGSRNTTVSVGSFSISRDSIALVCLPAIVSFLLFQTILDTKKASRLYIVFSALFLAWSPKASRNELDLVIDQPQPAYWGALVPSYRKGGRDDLDKLEEITSTVFPYIVFFGTIAFEGQAYYILFPEKISSIFVWMASLLVTLLCLVAGSYLGFADV